MQQQRRQHEPQGIGNQAGRSGNFLAVGKTMEKSEKGHDQHIDFSAEPDFTSNEYAENRAGKQDDAFDAGKLIFTDFGEFLNLFWIRTIAGDARQIFFTAEITDQFGQIRRQLNYLFRKPETAKNYQK